MKYGWLCGVAAATVSVPAAGASEDFANSAKTTEMAQLTTPAEAVREAAEQQPESQNPLQRPEIVITGARSILPATALPLTVDLLGGEQLDQQVAVSGSIIDALAARMPAFSPTREKLSGSGESLRGRSPLFAINGVPQSTPVRDGSAMATRSIRSSWSGSR